MKQEVEQEKKQVRIDDLSYLLYKDVLDIPAGEWLEQNIYMNKEVSPNAPGQLTLERQPWMRQILDSCMDPRTRQVELVMGAQTGKTTLLLLIWMLYAKFDPQPCVIALSTDPLAERIVKRRLLPLIKANSWYGNQLPPENKGMESMILFPGMPTFYCGARTPNKLASTPASLLLLDEVSKFQSGSTKEAHPMLLLRERCKSFATSLIVSSSTPSVIDDAFWSEYLHSSQSNYYMPCPHCGNFIKFEFNEQNIVWEGGDIETIRNTARYVCPCCKGSINDKDKANMMQLGEWRAERTKYDKSHLGYHLNSMYSPFVSWGDVAVEFIKANASVIKSEALRNFTNSWLALPWQPIEQTTSNEDILACIDNTRMRGEVPDDTVMVITGVDPGQDETHYVISAISNTGDIRVVDWGTLQSYSSYNGAEGIAKLVDKWKSKDLSWTIDAAFIDSGYATNEIYMECLSREYGKLNPTKGTSNPGVWSKKQLNNYETLDLYTYNDYILKMTEQTYYKDRIITLPSEAARDSAFIRGLSGQTLIKNKHGQLSWKALPDDHYSDALKLTVLAGIVAKVQPGELSTNN